MLLKYYDGIQDIRIVSSLKFGDIPVQLHHGAISDVITWHYQISNNVYLFTNYSIICTF